MKNIVFVVLLSLVIFSCEREDLKYSCNPEIDAIVKSGVIESSEINLSEFLDYDIEFQKAIFRSFTADKKRDFWLEKFDLVVVNCDFTPEEINHMQKLIEHITADYFSIKLDSLGFSHRKDFEYEWTSYAQEALLWNTPRIHFVVNSLCVTESQYHQIIYEQKEITLNALSYNCTCSTESDYCYEVGGDCEEDGCSTTDGCGWLWDYTCDGNCL